MADDNLLSDLCSICNTTKFKYRCPGCAARTCSLPCYKRHQQWAQCDGKRDPAKFVKRSELATPAGIDHDFNFLTSIERGLRKSERCVESTSSGTASDLQQDAHTRKRADLQLAATGVNIVRAPRGLSRQKENKTHRSKRGNTIWTVEWIRDDNTRILDQGTEVEPLIKLSPFKPETKKRKFHAEDLSSTTASADRDVSIPALVKDGEQIETKDKKLRLPTTGRSGIDFNDADLRGVSHNPQVSGHDDPSPLLHGAKPETLLPKYDFFLLRPRTSSSRRVLIPLNPFLPLSNCLRGRTVLEFPTIYLFPTSSSPPAEEFMLEDEYIKQEGEEQKEFQELLNHVSPETLRAIKNEHEDDKKVEEIDSRSILDVLNIGTAGM